MTAVVIDIQSPTEQQLRALDAGQERRLDAVEARREITGGVLTFADAIDDERLGPVPVWRVLLSVPGVGPQGMRAVLNRAGRRSNAGCAFAVKLVRDLTPLQRAALRDEVRRAPRLRKPRGMGEAGTSRSRASREGAGASSTSGART